MKKTLLLLLIASQTLIVSCSTMNNVNYEEFYTIVYNYPSGYGFTEVIASDTINSDNYIFKHNLHIAFNIFSESEFSRINKFISDFSFKNKTDKSKLRNLNKKVSIYHYSNGQKELLMDFKRKENLDLFLLNFKKLLMTDITDNQNLIKSIEDLLKY